MEKRGNLGVKYCWFFLAFLLFFLAFIEFSSALSFGEKYYVGESVKIDLRGLEEYSLKINTPTNTYVTQGNDSIFSYKLLEVGNYVISVRSKGNERNYFFEVFQANNTAQFSSNSLPQNVKDLIQQSKNIVKTNVSAEKSLKDSAKFVANSKARWTETYDLSGSSKKRIRVPSEILEYKVYSADSSKREIPSTIIPENPVLYQFRSLFGDIQRSQQIDLGSFNGNVELEYYTEGPKSEETFVSEDRKTVKVYSDAELGYTDVLAYAEVFQKIKMSDKNKIKIYWKEENRYLNFDAFDRDSNGYVDYVEWIVPHLSTQTFEIILISAAEHLDTNKQFISDLYEYVKDRDNIWSETINSEEYVRITFERNLSSLNDITIFPRVISGNPIVEVYEKGENVKIAEFSDIISNEYNRKILTNLVGEQDSFDLKIVGGALEFDHIIDPVAYPGGSIELRPQMCMAQGSSSTQYDFTSACDGTYSSSCGASGDLLSCDDGFVETHAAGRTTGGGGGPRYGGVNATYYNSLIGDCYSITDVQVCYQMWTATTGYTCDVAVDNDGGASFVNVATGACATSDPAAITCVNVTASEAWNCTNFFGSSGMRAQAVANSYKTSNPSGSTTLSVDVLFFNVSYATPPVGDLAVILNAPNDATVLNNLTVSFNYTPIASSSFTNCSIWDNSSGTFSYQLRNTTAIVNGTPNYISKTFSSSGTYNWNIQCCTASNCTFAISNRTVSFDLVSPNVTLLSPANNSNISDPFSYYFTYNVTDTISSISSCSIYVDGTFKQQAFSINEGQSNSFSQYISNGVHLWSVACEDSSGNIGFSENRTINVSVYPPAFTNIFYETSKTNFTGNNTAVISLNNSIDGTTNSASFILLSGQSADIVEATSAYISNNGALIPGGTTVTFASTFEAAHAPIYITWKLYISNSTGDTILCQNGNDAAGGTSMGTAQLTVTNTTCINRNIRLHPSDRILLITTAFYNPSPPNKEISFTHSWDGATTNSYVNLNVTTEGFLSINLTSPLSDSTIQTGELLQTTCNVSCSVGICRNTLVYIQYNSSSTNWTNISGTGSLILHGTETNNHRVGNLSGSTTTNFNITGNVASVNNIRCMAYSDYDSVNGTLTRQITVSQSQDPPVVNLTSPASGYWFNSSQVVLYYNVSDINNNLANSTLILNGLRNQTNQSALLNYLINNFTINLPDGYYNWTVNVTDTTYLNASATPIRNFSVDTVSPNIILLSPNNSENFTRSYVEFNFTAVDYLSDNLLCNITLNGNVLAQNFFASNGTVTNRTITGLSTGVYYWNVTCIDYAGNRNISETRNFTILNTPPNVTLVTQNNSFFNSTSNIVLYYNATDNDGFTNATLILNGQIYSSNSSEVVNNAISNFTVNLAEGRYNWTVNVTDTGGLNASASLRYFTVDQTLPSIFLVSPSNNSRINSSTFSYSFRTTDNLDGSMLCNISVGEKSSLNVAATNGSTINGTISGLTDGLKIWNVTCIDDAGNRNISENWQVNFTVVPTIQLQTANATAFNSSNINLSYIPSDNTNLSRCELVIDGAVYQSNSSAINNGVQNNFSLTMPDGNYNWSVACFDYLNLTNSSETRFFSVDTQKPSSIQIYYPENDMVLFASTIIFNYTVIDSVDSTLLCNVTVNSVVENSTIARNGSVTNATVLFTTGGLKIWNVTCIDDAGNFNISETRNFTLAFPPVISLISPANNTITNISEIVFTYNITDANDNIANTSLVLNGLINQTNQSQVIAGQYNNFTLVLADGNYNWTINATDLTNLEAVNNSIRRLMVDTTPPQLVLNAPLGLTNVTDNNITFNFTTTDNLSTNLSCSISLDNGGGPQIINLNVTNGTNSLYSIIRDDGEYTWNVLCIDWAGNSNQSLDVNFTVEAPPNVTLVSPQNNNITNISTISFVYRPYDAVGFTSCSLYINGQINSTTPGASVVSGQNNLFGPIAGLPQGLNNWTVECTDSAPDLNSYSPPVRNFTVDLTKPSIYLSTPLNSTNTLRRVEFNFTSIDNLDLDLNCSLYIDNNLNKTNISALNNSLTSVSTSGLSLGTHSWNVTCIDDAGNRNFSERRLFNVTLSDFYVDPSSITFNNTSPRENEPNALNATIYNLANVSVPNVTVQFFLGNPQTTGVQIGSNQTIYNFEGLSSQIVSVQINTSNIGYNTVFVVVDPIAGTNGLIEEWNETNNIANSTVTVSAWQYIYGSMTPESEFVLQNNADLGLISWATSTFDSANLYISDYDSVIFWSNLNPIGKNTSGQNTSNDFSDIDTLLNMTGLQDSVNKIYTNNTNANYSTDEFLIFNRYVSNVPIAQSINNSNFHTGILWDTTKDTNNQFDVVNKEDIVFITKVNQGALGAYGNYDYEIRVPAKLRNYYNTDGSKVSFYSEIH